MSNKKIKIKSDSKSSYLYVSGKTSKSFSKIKVSKSHSKFVSVIVPTYYEEELIEKLIDSLTQNLKKYSYEIVIVDDNSQDKTPEIIDRKAKKNSNVVAFHRYGKKGVFSAQCDGVKVCKGKIIVFMDADFSHPPNKIPKMLEKMKEKKGKSSTSSYDIVVGSRFINGGGIIAPFLRKYPTTMLNYAIKIILGMGMPITDFTGVFHAMKTDIFRKIKFKYDSEWGDFDMELLYRLNKMNCKMAEIPFTYDFRKEGESKQGGFFSIIKYGYIYISKAIKIRFSE